MQKICIVPKSTRCIRVPETVHEHLVSWLITSARLHLEQMQHHMHSLDRCRCWPLLHVTWSVCQLGTWVRCAKWMNRLWAHLGQIRVCCIGLTAPPLEGAFWGGGHLPAHCLSAWRPTVDEYIRCQGEWQNMAMHPFAKLLVEKSVQFYNWFTRWGFTYSSFPAPLPRIIGPNVFCFVNDKQWSTSNNGTWKEALRLFLFCFNEFAFTVQVKHKMYIHKFLAFFDTLYFTTGHFHTCVGLLCKECSLFPF